MSLPLLLAAAVPVIAAAGWLRHMSRRHGLGPLMWRWHSGHSLDGVHRTNATWTKRSHGARPVLHPTGHAVRWHHRPRLHRAGIRIGAELAAAAVLYGLWADRAVTLAFLAIAAAAGLALAAWRGVHAARNWRYRRHYVRPLEGTLMWKIPAPPATLEIDRHGDVIKGVVIEWPPETEIGEPEKQHVLEAVTTRLAIEAPEPQWQLKGRRRRVVLTPSSPPPSLVTWDDIAAEVACAQPDELLVGVGKKSSIVKVSLKDDSPHFLISMGSGAGKSTTAAFWVVQELIRGGIALFLDPKQHSHPWAFKDMDAEFAQLPNVAYVRRTPDIHNAMEWLGGELGRRNDVATAGINSKGDLIKGNVGPRIFIIAEEMNLAEGPLKQYWAETRGKDDPKKSPAFTGLGAVAFAGRAVKMHLVVIGQQVTAAVLGGGAVRENMGVRCLARYQQNSWKMLAGDIPMPPSPSVPGRVQCIASGGVREAQVPYVDIKEDTSLLRELAVSGTVTPCPAGMPGAAPGRELAGIPVPGRTAIDAAPGQGVVVGQLPALTLREAVEQGVFGRRSLTATRKMLQRTANPPQPVGTRDRAHEYLLSDLYAIARGASDDS